MLYECELTFLEKKPFIFFDRSDVHSIEKNKKYDMLVSLSESKLSILNNEHHQLCYLLVDNYQCRLSGDKTFIAYLPRDKRKEDAKDFDVLELHTQSKALVELLTQKLTKKVRVYSSALSYTPSRQANTSLLSTQSPEQKFRGFLNLAVIIMVVLNLRNILSNFQRYGNQLASGEWKLINLNGLPVLGTLFAHITVQYLIERLLFTKKITHKVCRILTIIHVLFALGLHMVICQKIDLLPIPGLFLTAYLMVIVLKIISYYQINAEIYEMTVKMQQFKTNENYRELLAPHEIDNGNLKLIAENKNDLLKLLSFKHLMYFVAAPTLCYQLTYPRNASIRLGWIAKRFAELFVILALQFVLWAQYYQPALDKLVGMINAGQSTYLELFQQLLEMSIPTILIWVGGFYAFFQVWLNILAEALRFADRRFYEDWWNCKNLIQYWKLWNLPVHYWFIRHLYNPLLKRGVSKLVANLLVFLVSAVAHEYLVSVPLGVASYYAFLAMLLQSPMIYVEMQFNKLLKLEDSELGNVSFWISYCIIGQPICVCIYYYLYINKEMHRA